MKQIVLMYHDVYELNKSDSGFNTPGANHYKISKEVFSEHVDIIFQYCKKKGISKESIVFTFDDGGISFYTIIAPILEKYGWKGIFFISTKYIDTNGFMSSDQVEDLHRRGHVIGAHSHSHQVLTNISLEEVRKDLSQNKSILEQTLKCPIETISIPNGNYTADVLKVIIDNDFNPIYISKPTSIEEANEGVLLIGRYAIVSSTSANDVLRIISSSYYRNWMLFKYEILKVSKLLLGSNYNKIRTAIIKGTALLKTKIL